LNSILQNRIHLSDENGKKEGLNKYAMLVAETRIEGRQTISQFSCAADNVDLPYHGAIEKLAAS